LAAATALLPAAGLAAGPDRSKPPSVGSPKSLKLPPVQKVALSNGLPVMLADMREVPVVEVAVAVRAGAAADALDRTGVACMAVDILDEGAAGKDALAIADSLDLLGAELTTSCSWDAVTVRLHVPTARLAAALPILADVVLRPSFRVKDLDRLRREALTELLQARDDPDQLAGFGLARAVFGNGHRYGLPLEGDAASLTAMRIADVRNFHAKQFRPENAALVVAGAVDAATALPLLQGAFGAWAKGGAPAAPIADAAQVSGRAVLVVDRPGAAQSALRVGRVSPARSTSDYHALEVMNTLLGGSFTSRLNDNLREQHGYAYGARSSFDFRRAAGLFSAAANVHTPSTADALREFIAELQRIRAPAKKDEVERARNYLAYGYPQDFETTRQVASKLADQFIYGLLDDEYTGFVSRVSNVEVRDVQRVAQAAIDADNLAVVVVGDAAKIERSLRPLNLGPTSVMSVEQLMGPPPRIEAPPRPEQ
jgi:zinc protease